MNLPGKIFQTQLKIIKLHHCGGELVFFMVLLQWALFDFNRKLPHDVITSDAAFLSVRGALLVASSEQHSILFAFPLS